MIRPVDGDNRALVRAGLAVLSLVTVHSRHQVWLVYTVTLVYGCVGSVLSSARSALLTRMLSPDLLGHANAALQTLGEGSRLVSPLVGAGLFEFVEGVIRWDNRVIAYAFVLVTDQYPPFRLSS